MRNKLSELDDLINDVITVSETTLDWKIKHRLIFSDSVSKPIIGLLYKLGFLSQGYDFPHPEHQTDVADVLAFVKLLQTTQESIEIVMNALHKKAIESMAGGGGQEDKMAGIQTKPEPYCPDCGTRMKLRRPHPNALMQFKPFWGCGSRLPTCRSTRQIGEDRKAEKV